MNNSISHISLSFLYLSLITLADPFPLIKVSSFGAAPHTDCIFGVSIGQGQLFNLTVKRIIAQKNSFLFSFIILKQRYLQAFFSHIFCFKQLPYMNYS